MNMALRVGLVMAFMLMTIVSGAAVFFFFSESHIIKHIKCKDKTSSKKTMVISIDEKLKEISVAGKKISGTEIEVFSDVEILAEWFSSNGHTKFWLDRITGELNITTSSGDASDEATQTFSCEATRPIL